MKKISILLVVVVLLSAIVGTASAQQERQQRPGVNALRELVQIVAEETGLTTREILAQLQEGLSLADVISANGGDVNTVISAATEAATTAINEAVANGNLPQERADQMLANLETVITNGINGEFDRPQGGQNGRQQAQQFLMQSVSDATGLSNQEIMTQVRGGMTLAEVIEANGGSVDAVVGSAVAAATEAINTMVSEGKLTQEQADETIATLETAYTDAVNGDLAGQRPENGRPGPRPDDAARSPRDLAGGVVRAAAESAGLDARDLMTQLRDGAILADILSANGVDVQTFIDDQIAKADERLNQAVESGRITTEQKDAFLSELSTRLTDFINNPRPQRTQ